MAPKIEVTPEIVQAVHENDCKLRGHFWAFQEEIGSEFPVVIFCTHCGISADVVPKSADN